MRYLDRNIIENIWRKLNKIVYESDKKYKNILKNFEYMEKLRLKLNKKDIQKSIKLNEIHISK